MSGLAKAWKRNRVVITALFLIVAVAWVTNTFLVAPADRQFKESLNERDRLEGERIKARERAEKEILGR